MKSLPHKKILVYLTPFWQQFVTQKFFTSPYDRLLIAVTHHRLDDAIAVLEHFGCHDPEVQCQILAACQRRDVEVCDA